MIESLITSSTRIKLLLKFFLNPNYQSYLRKLSDEFGESTNGIRVELNKLSEAKLINSFIKGKIKYYQANPEHPLFEDIRNIVLKSTGIDKVISNILNKIGNLKLAFIKGDYAIGKDTGLIDLVIVGKSLNINEILRVQYKTERLIKRKINLLLLTVEEYEKLRNNFTEEPVIILFNGEKN